MFDCRVCQHVFERGGGTALVNHQPNHSQTVDTLRGFALLGIFVVNIQSYVWGMGAPMLGMIDAASSMWDKATLVFIATIFEYKTYPIFCFCFGYGFAVLARKWRILGVNSDYLFSRRLSFMLVLGLLHGVFIWFGDILARYAIAGFVLKRGIRFGPRANWKRFKFWLAIHIGTSVILLTIAALFSFVDAITLSAQVSAEDPRIAMQLASEVYKTGGYWAQTTARIGDFLYVLSSVFFLIPALLCLFLLGTLAAQCRLLTLAHLPRYRTFWRNVALTAFAIGAPLSLAYGYLQLQAAERDNAVTTTVISLLGEFGPVLATGYIAAIALMSRPTDQPATWFYRLFAPAGRMALTIYISQSILMMIFLNGFFPTITYPYRDSQLGLLGLSLACYTGLLAIAHVFARHNLQGPLEILWRRHTNQPRN